MLADVQSCMVLCLVPTFVIVVHIYSKDSPKISSTIKEISTICILCVYIYLSLCSLYFIVKEIVKENLGRNGTSDSAECLPLSL